MAAGSAAFVLRMERVVTAGPATVFEAFAVPDELSQWWGPDGFTIPAVDFDPRLGAGYRIQMQPPGGDAFFLTGEFREVDPPARLAFTFVWEPPDPDDVETLAELTFRDVGQATEIGLTQGRFRTEARRDLHRDGWTESLDKLERLVTP